VGVAAAVAVLAAACGGGGGSGDTSAYLKWAPCCSWDTTWSLNAYSPLALTIGDGLIQLPLAVENMPSLTSFTPQLATSWPVSGNTLTINLRSGAKWETGKPVTSTDVLDTIELNGLGGTAGSGDTGGWLYISKVTAPNANQVVVTTRPGSNMSLLEDQILSQVILPSSTYGQFVSPALEQDEIAYWAQGKDPAAAAKLPQYAAMQVAFKKLSAYNVPKLIGDGPFTLKAVNTAEALLMKSPSFYDAASIHIPGIEYTNDPNQNIYPLLLGGQADFSSVYMPPAILKQWQSTTGSNTAIPHGFIYNLAINSHAYPLNMTTVRQAIAYVIPRSNMVSSAYGDSSVKDRGAVLNQYPDGLPTYLNSLYLTSSELASLNPYSVNDAKATSLLQSAGFRKSGGKWIMPNGKPFTLSLLVDSATTNDVVSLDSAATALTAFGISSSVDATQGAIVSADTLNGNFQLAEDNAIEPDPLADFEALLGPGANFETLGSYAGDRGLGFGPAMTVPGLGTVNVPSIIAQQSEEVGPGAKMNQLVWDWARLVNQQLPYITYATKVYTFPFSSQRFTDWPPMDSAGTSPLWNIMGQGNFNEGLALMLEGGYIRPKT
jgi:peptide/nickel transport system substrate-binding protein